GPPGRPEGRAPAAASPRRARVLHRSRGTPSPYRPGPARAPGCSGPRGRAPSGRTADRRASSVLLLGAAGTATAAAPLTPGPPCNRLAPLIAWVGREIGRAHV